MNAYAISDAELEIMQVVWGEGGRILFAPLMKRLRSMGKQWKANTVLTFLSRLTEKGMLSVEKRGRLNQYIASYDKGQYVELLTHSFLGKFYGGDAKSLVVSLIRQDWLSAEDVVELQEFWREEGGVYE